MNKQKLLFSLILSNAWLFWCSGVQAIALNFAEKQELISNQAYSLDQLILYMVENKSTNITNQEGTINENGWKLNTQGTIGESEFTSSYVGNFYENSNLVSWTQTGKYGYQTWNSSGTAQFLDDNETIILNAFNSLTLESGISSEPNWAGTSDLNGGASVSVTYEWGGNESGKWSFAAEGTISNNFSNTTTGELTGSLKWEQGETVKGSILGKISDKDGKTTKEVTSKFETDGKENKLSITGKAGTPEPMTTFGTVTAIGLGVALKRKLSKIEQKNK